MNLEFEQLRVKNKTALAKGALRLYKYDPSDIILSYWVDFLLSGRGVIHMIDCLKQGKPTAEEIESHKTETPADLVSHYAGALEIRRPIEVMRAGIPEKLEVSITNLSKVIWKSDIHARVNASYHWLDFSGKMVRLDGIRTPLPAAIGPGETYPLELSVTPPPQRGRYQLQLTLVHEGVCWFEERGFNAVTLPINVDWCLPASTSRVLEEFEYLRGLLAEEGKMA